MRQNKTLNDVWLVLFQVTAVGALLLVVWLMLHGS